METLLQNLNVHETASYAGCLYDGAPTFNNVDERVVEDRANLDAWLTKQSVTNIPQITTKVEQ